MSKWEWRRGEAQDPYLESAQSNFYATTRSASDRSQQRLMRGALLSCALSGVLSLARIAASLERQEK